MTEKTSVGVRLPSEYLKEIDEISETTGRSRSQIMVEAVELYLGKTPLDSVKSDLGAIRKRVELLERAIEFLSGSSLHQLEKELERA